MGKVGSSSASAAAERWEVCLESGEAAGALGQLAARGQRCSLALQGLRQYVWVQPQPEDPRLGVDGLQP